MDEPEVDIDLIESDTTCSICYAEFLDSKDLEIHKKQMHPTGIISCQFCSRLQASSEDYAVHIRDDHLTTLCMCQFCTRVFTDENYCKKHEKKHIMTPDTASYSCSRCDSHFINVSELERHEYDYHKEGDVTEGLWLQEHMPLLSSVLNMNFAHCLQTMSLKNKFTCAICGAMSRHIDGYIQHLKNSNCRSNVCNFCFHVYRSRRGVIKHLTSRQECNLNRNIMKECPHCSKKFDLHLWKYHQRHCKVMTCQKCQIVFSTMEDLSKHQTEKHPLVISLQVCKYCKKEFVGTVALEKHIERTHNVDMYKYRCVYCDMVYKHPQKLFGHFFSQHKDIEPYLCKICDKKFRIRKNFTIHIKLEHKSIGFVEFDDKFHVYFTDKKPEKPKTDKKSSNKLSTSTKKSKMTEESKDITQNSDTNAESDLDNTNKSDTNVDPKKIEKHSNSNLLIEIDMSPVRSDYVPTETDAQTDVESKKRLKRKVKTTKNDPDIEYLSESSDDEPLENVKTKMRKAIRSRGRPRKVFKKSLTGKTDTQTRFTCKFCNKFCYTFHKYHHHMNTVHQNEKADCVKCGRMFPSKMKLSEHIKKEHSSSKLTETLKNLLEKRKSNNNSSTVSSNTFEPLTNTEKFQKTIKKVSFDRSEEPATLAPSSTSVQKFIENFTPETESKKDIVIENHITIKNVSCPPKKPFIKMTKFEPKPHVRNTLRSKLAMPVTFKPDFEQHNVTVKVVQAEERPLFVNQYPTETYYDNNDYDHYEEMVMDEKPDHIPEVAQEVMLEGSEETPKPRTPIHKVVIPKIPKELNQIRIATLLPEAPYYKILKIKDVLKNAEKEEKKEETEKEKEIILPNGTKLVSVNPLAHLLGNTPVEKVFQSTYKYYQHKPVDFEKAVAKALMSENKPKKVNKSNKKKKASKAEP